MVHEDLRSWPYDGGETHDYSRAAWERRNLAMMVVLYVGCLLITIGVMCL